MDEYNYFEFMDKPPDDLPDYPSIGKTWTNVTLQVKGKHFIDNNQMFYVDPRSNEMFQFLSDFMVTGIDRSAMLPCISFSINF